MRTLKIKSLHKFQIHNGLLLTRLMMPQIKSPKTHLSFKGKFRAWVSHSSPCQSGKQTEKDRQKHRERHLVREALETSGKSWDCHGDEKIKVTLCVHKLLHIPGLTQHCLLPENKLVAYTHFRTYPNRTSTKLKHCQFSTKINS